MKRKKIEHLLNENPKIKFWKEYKEGEGRTIH